MNRKIYFFFLGNGQIVLGGLQHADETHCHVHRPMTMLVRPQVDPATRQPIPGALNVAMEAYGVIGGVVPQPEVIEFVRASMIQEPVEMPMLHKLRDEYLKATSAIALA